MNTSNRDALLALLATAAERVAPASPHVAEDEELATAWVYDTLAPDERRAVATHLAGCAPCRHRLAAVVEAHRPDSPPTPRPSRSRRLQTVVAALAAAILLALGWTLLSGGEAARALARAERTLSDGQAAEALARLESLRPERLSRQQADRRAELIERSAYTLAREGLTARHYDEVERLCERARAAGGWSGRLAALQLQARRGDPQAEALSECGSLLQWGYEPSGQPVPWKKPALQLPAVEAAFRAAVADFPEDPTLLSHFGEFLLSVGARPEEVDGIFKRAVAADPTRAAGHLGRGIAAFKTKRFTDAVTHFRAAEAIAPNSVPVLTNLAMTHERLNDPVAAQGYRDRAKKAANGQAP